MTVPALAVQLPGVGSVSADNLNTYVQGTPLATDLRNFPGLTGMQVNVCGSAAVGDGGAGAFYYSPSSTAPDDGVNVIVPSGNVQGAWLRSGFLSPQFNTSIWTPYTPTIAIIGGSGTSASNVSFSYQMYGKALFLRGQFVVNYATTPTSVSATLPTGFTALSGVTQTVSTANQGTTLPLASFIAGDSNVINIYAASNAVPVTATGQPIYLQGLVEVN